LQIPLAKPDITEKEIEAVSEVLHTPKLSLGPKLNEFEKRLAEYGGVKYAVVVNSGTSALHLAIRALNIGEGDEVITTPFSFIASANCILFEKGRPVFVDIDPLTWNIDPNLIEAKITERTKAILAVDLFGYPADWDRLREIAKKYNLKLIEDAAEAIGAEYKGKKAGSLGDVAVFAFYPNKQITTGEGGAILTNDERVAELCRSLRNQGREDGKGWFEHVRLGYNYRLSEINCALGIVQLKRLEEILSKRERIAQIYNKKLKEIEEIQLPQKSPDIRRSWFVYVIKLRDDFTMEQRDKILKYLQRNGIECRGYFAPIHLQPLYKKLGYSKGDFPLTEAISARTIALPFYSDLDEERIDYICRCLIKGLKEVAQS